MSDQGVSIDALPCGERLVGELQVLCYQVQRGKPASAVALQERYASSVSGWVVREYGLQTHVEALSPGWVTLWVFRHPHILDVIRSLKQAPETAMDHWILGKLFGYSEEAIQQFLLPDLHK